MNSQTSNTKQAAWLGIGSMSSFAIGVISSMILSRFLPKGDYGTYKQVLYVYETLLVVFTLGLPRAYSYFLPRININQAKSLIKKISVLFLLMGGVMSILLFVFADYIGDFLNNPDLSGAIRLFAIVPTLLLPTMGLDGILATFKRARLMALYNVLSKFVMLIFITSPILLLNMGYKEAIIGFVLSSIFSFLLAEFLIYYPLRKNENERCEISYNKIFAFSLPLLFASLWGILQMSADSFFISRYFGKEIFAEFANGNMDLPFVSMIVSSCAMVLSPVFSKMSSEKLSPHDDVMPIWKSAFEKSAMLIYPLVLYSIVYSDILMTLLYGQQYEVSGTYFSIRTIVCFFNVIAIGPLLINVGYVNYYSRVQMCSAIAVVILEYISVITIHSPYAISMIQLICRVGAIVVYMLFIANYFGVSVRRLLPFKNISKIFVVSLALLVILKFLTNLIALSELYTIVVSFVVYSLLFLFVSRRAGVDYLQLLGLKKS